MESNSFKLLEPDVEDGSCPSSDEDNQKHPTSQNERDW